MYTNIPLIPSCIETFMLLPAAKVKTQQGTLKSSCQCSGNSYKGIFISCVNDIPGNLSKEKLEWMKCCDV